MDDDDDEEDLVDVLEAVERQYGADNDLNREKMKDVNLSFPQKSGNGDFVRTRTTANDFSRETDRSAQFSDDDDIWERLAVAAESDSVSLGSDRISAPSDVNRSFPGSGRGRQQTLDQFLRRGGGGTGNVTTRVSVGDELVISPGQRYTGPPDLSESEKVLLPYKSPPGFPAFDFDRLRMPSFPAVDLESAKVWIFPSNRQKRDYQFNIIKNALFRNTLVTLPTGLGKTFIAAIVMHNFFRWFPVNQIVFMAPTRPLVRQQVEECVRHGGFPLNDTVELTGTTRVDIRAGEWRTKRIVFATPQVVANDIEEGRCDPRRIVLLVVDEAHRATGRYGYVVAVERILERNPHFRVLGLTATPGSDVDQVQRVIQNLTVSHLETRSEMDKDVRSYSHSRAVEEIRVPLGPYLLEIRDLFALAVKKAVFSRLAEQGVLRVADVDRLRSFAILKQAQHYQQHPNDVPRTRDSARAIASDLYIAHSLSRAYEQLCKYGLPNFCRILSTKHLFATDPKKQIGGTRGRLLSSPEWASMILKIHVLQKGERDHPKLEALRRVISDHFRSVELLSPQQQTRVMVFSSLRDSVSTITDCLDAIGPHVKVMGFVGHTSTSTRGLSPKEQTDVIRRFRSGGYNVLVATCVGEEGLDIGEVDLIVCFDVQANPTRMVQRMGRTGRKRQGRVVCLVAEGIEEGSLSKMHAKGRSVHKALIDRKKFSFYVQPSSILPPDLPKPELAYREVSNSSPYRSPQKRRSGPTRAIGLTPPTLSQSLNVSHSVFAQAMPSPTGIIEHGMASLLLVRLVSQIEDGNCPVVDRPIFVEESDEGEKMADSPTRTWDDVFASTQGQNGEEKNKIRVDDVKVTENDDEDFFVSVSVSDSDGFRVPQPVGMQPHVRGGNGSGIGEVKVGETFLSNTQSIASNSTPILERVSRRKRLRKESTRSTRNSRAVRGEVVSPVTKRSLPVVQRQKQLLRIRREQFVIDEAEADDDSPDESTEETLSHPSFIQEDITEESPARMQSVYRQSLISRLDRLDDFSTSKSADSAESAEFVLATRSGTGTDTADIDIAESL